MSSDELKEKRQALLDEVEGATAERFEEIEKEVADVDSQLDEAIKAEEEARAKAEEAEVAEKAAHEAEEKAKEEAEAEKRAAREPKKGTNADKVVLFDNCNVKEEKSMTAEEKRSVEISALAKGLRRAAGRKTEPYTEEELRALGVAYTTTSEEYVEPTADVNGVNNGGLLIPSTMLTDLLTSREVNSPIFNGVRKYNMKGIVVFPYAKQVVGDPATKELQDSTDVSIEFANLELKNGDYALTVALTFELLAQADDVLVPYVLDQLEKCVAKTIVPDVIYGSGADGHVAGIVGASEEGTCTDVLDGIHAGLAALSVEAIQGASIFVARDIYLDLAFAKDEDGRPLHPLFNESGIATIATYPVVVDEYLNAGEFIIGNPYNYLLNEVKGSEIYPENKGRERRVEETIHTMIAGAPCPDCFYHGTVVAPTSVKTTSAKASTSEEK